MKMQCSQTRTLDLRERCDDCTCSQAPAWIKVHCSCGSAAFPAGVGAKERTHARDSDCYGVSGIQQTSRQAWVDDEVHHHNEHTSHKMASQLMPLELIDRCIGSRMRVIMKGDKGEPSPARTRSASGLTISQSSVAPYSDSMISSVCEIFYL